MKRPRSFSNPQAFKTALEQRIRDSAAATAMPIGRKRQLIVFDRFLARIATAFGDNVTVKGGLVLEHRLTRSRTTKDVDLQIRFEPEELLMRLQEAGRLDLGDFMTFELSVNREHRAIRTGGSRFTAKCLLAGKIYGDVFGVDVAVGDSYLGEPHQITADDVLGFAGVAPPNLRLYPIETHIAEKLHAYTLPRAMLNGRVKDLPDIALLASIQALDARVLRAALEKTFTQRGSHGLPDLLPPPPTEWEAPFAAMVREDGLPWTSLHLVTQAARAFLDPVLSGTRPATWDPKAWLWHDR